MMRVITVIILFAALSAAAYVNDPLENGWTPKCVMLAVTGYRCPGCGIQRFAHAMLHGQIREAVAYNYFAAIWLPLLSAYGLLHLSRTFLSSSFVCRFASAKTVGMAYVVTYVIWWVARNIINV